MSKPFDCDQIKHDLQTPLVTIKLGLELSIEILDSENSKHHLKNLTEINKLLNNSLIATQKITNIINGDSNA